MKLPARKMLLAGECTDTACVNSTRSQQFPSRHDGQMMIILHSMCGGAAQCLEMMKG